MLVEITGEHSGSVIMFGDVATRLFRMMGLSGNTEGAIQSADLPAALERLEAALAQQTNDSPAAADDDGDRPVSMATRAVPLIKLLQENIAAGGYVMWREQ